MSRAKPPRRQGRLSLRLGGFARDRVFDFQISNFGLSLPLHFAALFPLTTTQLGCLHDLPSVVSGIHRFRWAASATQTFQPGASTPGNSSSRPFRFLAVALGPRVYVMYFPSGDQMT